LCGAAVAAPGLGVAEAVTNFVPPVVPAAQSDLETGRRGRWTKPMLVCGVAITAPGVVLGMLAVLLLLVSLALSWSALARMLWGFWRLLTGHETEQAGLR
jgi:hypothetical protein